MRRTTTTLATALTAGLALPGVAMGAAGDLAPVQPVTGDVEAIGDGLQGTANIIVAFNAVGGATAIADGVIQVQFLDNTGANTGPVINVAGSALTEINGDADTNIDNGEVFQIDLFDGGAGALAVAPANAFGFDVIFNDGGGGTDTLVNDADGFPGQGDDDDSDDTTYEINRTPPTLTDALIDDTDDDGVDDAVFFVGNFNDLGPDGSVANSLKNADNLSVANPNDTDSGVLNQLDFEFSTDGGMTFNQFVAGEDITTVGAVANGDTFIRVNINQAMGTMTSLATGVQVRVDPSTGRVRDITGQLMGGEVAIEDLDELAIQQVKWENAVPVGSGGVAGALKVTFNLPLSTAGNMAFWDNLALDGGGATDLTVDSAMLDPDDSSCVLLQVSSTADGVADDGLGLGNADGEAFEVAVDDMTGTPPNDIFGNAFTGTQTVDIGDGIAPTTVGAPFTIDQDGDGVVDAFGQYFSEGIDVSGADTDGFTLTKLAATVHPISLFTTNLDSGITDPTDAMNEDMVELDMMTAENNEFQDAIGTFGTDDQDPTGANRLQVMNCLIIPFDPTAVDWDNDGNVGAADTDGEATPGTFDTAFASLDIDFSMAGVTDKSDCDNEPSGMFSSNVTVDGADAVAVQAQFETGDNNDAGGMAKISEKDEDGDEPDANETAEVGDQEDNDTLRLIFNEEINAGGVDETQIRFGASSAERFAGGDSMGVSGAGNNILSLVDGDGDGLDVGDTITISDNNGITDAAGNAYPGTSPSGAPTLVTTDASSPFVLLQVDINGNAIHSAFLRGIDENGFATQIVLQMSQVVKASTVDDSDFSIEGVQDADVSASANGAQIVLSFPTGNIAADNVVRVTYNGGSDTTPIASDEGLMGAVSMMDDSFDARRIPEPNVDGEFPAVLKISGEITGPDGEPAPAGSKIRGFIAVPRVLTVSARVNGMRQTIAGFATGSTDYGSINAMTNALHKQFGPTANRGSDPGRTIPRGGDDNPFNPDGPFLEGDDENNWSYSNFKPTGSGIVVVIPIVNININVNNNFFNVSFSGNGRTTPAPSGGGQTQSVNIQNGAMTVCWDLLKSSDGTAASYFNNGFQVNGEPIASSAVLTEDDGSYMLFMTAPINAFNGFFDTRTFPVIIVVELPDGERFAVSSLANAIDNQGPITFEALNRQASPAAMNDADITFNIDLSQNVSTDFLHQGWNLAGHDRNSGVELSNNAVLLPNGVTEANVLTPELDNVHPLSQFAYFLDRDGDGVWTRDDDDPDQNPLTMNSVPFGSLVIDALCLDAFFFTMTDRGVKIGNAIDAFTGGYGAGVFLRDSTSVGGFRFGPELGSGPAFSDFPVNNTNLGWCLITAREDFDDPQDFLSQNGADFLVEFERSGANAVVVSTFGATAGGTTESINKGQVYFVHKIDN